MTQFIENIVSLEDHSDVREFLHYCISWVTIRLLLTMDILEVCSVTSANERCTKKGFFQRKGVWSANTPGAIILNLWKVSFACNRCKSCEIKYWPLHVAFLWVLWSNACRLCFVQPGGTFIIDQGTWDGFILPATRQMSSSIIFQTPSKMIYFIATVFG